MAIGLVMRKGDTNNMNVLEKILEEIKNLKAKQDSENQDCCTGYLSALSTIEGIVSGVKENNDWIPASKRLPEENGYYLITVKELNYGEHVTMSFFDKYDMRGWQHVHMVNKKVTAWKSLPEPYKGE